MKILKRLLIVVLLLLAAGYWYARPLLRVGAGYSAKMACTCHFMQGRSLESIHNRDLGISVMPFYEQSVLEDEKKVKSSLWGISSAEAQFVKGRGCVLLSDFEINATPERAKPRNIKQVEIPQFDSLPEALNIELLKIAVDSAFVPVPGGETRAVVVLYDGKLVYESYAEGFEKEIPQLGWSMTKSITNALVGIMVKNGKLQLEQDHLFSEWEKDERSLITLNNLLQMNSGLEWNEAYGDVSDVTKMLFFESDMGAFALNKPKVFERGANWVYSSGTTNILSKLIRKTLNNDLEYKALLQDSLFVKLGMNSAFVEQDPTGSFIGSSYGWATPQDWAKFGQLYLQDGVWNDERILPAGWVEYSSQVANGSGGIYGAQVWLKGEDLANAPDDIFAFQGYQGQRVMVIPSHNCVIVRMGRNDDVKFDFDRLLTGVLAGLPD